MRFEQRKETLLFDLLTFVETTVGTDLVGAGGLVTIGAFNQFWENQMVSTPAGALASGRMAAFLQWCHAEMILSFSNNSFNNGYLDRFGRRISACFLAPGMRVKSA